MTKEPHKFQVATELPAFEGRIPPQDVLMEKSVLGGLMTDQESLHLVEDVLSPPVFYKIEHQRIYEAICALSRAHEPFDMISVVSKLKSFGILDMAGGVHYIAELVSMAIATTNIEYHAKVLEEKYALREIIRASGESYNAAYMSSSDPLTLLGDAQTAFSGIEAGLKGRTDVHTAAQLWDSTIEDDWAKVNKPEAITGVPTGLDVVDHHMGGLQGTDLIILAARPAVGKTSLAVQIALNSSLRGYPTAIFSLEMGREQIFQKVKGIYFNFPPAKLLRGPLSRHDVEVMAADTTLKGLPLFIEDTAHLHIDAMRAKIKHLVRKEGVKLVIVDYLQLAQGTGGSREQEISYIARGLKVAAKENGIPILALAQLSRAVETRGGDKRPMLSDLRECLAVDTSEIYTSAGVQRNSASRINLLSLNKKEIKDMPSSNIPKTSNVVYRLKSTTGRFIDCTANHPILTSSGYKPLKDISKEDSIALALNWTNKDSSSVPEARFMGWMLGNGCMYGYNVPSFITADKEIADEFCGFIERRFGYTPKDHPHYHSKVFQYDCTNSPTGNRTKEGNSVTRWLKEKDMWGNKAKEKHIPEWFMQKADDQSVIELLRGLWETDGSVPVSATQKGRTTAQYSTTSHTLATQILYLLARLGVVANLDNGHMTSKATSPCFKLCINSAEQLGAFRDTITLSGPKGQKLRDAKLATRQSLQLNKLNRDTTLLLSSVMSQVGKGTDRVQAHGGRRLTKHGLKALLEKFPKELEQFSWVASENIFWDPVDSIEEIGVRDVFDRSVPKTNNFVVNGIIVHNSGAIEQDADIVTFLYRPEYYGLEVDEGIKEGAAELIIAKYRTGATGTLPLLFDKKTTGFTDYETKSVTTGMPRSGLFE